MFVELNAEIAEALLRKVRREQDAYNEDWAWWLNDAEAANYHAAEGIDVSVIHRDTKYAENSYGDQEPNQVLVFQFIDTKTRDSLYFKIEGIFNSYGDYESHGQLVQVEPTERTVTVYDYI